MRGALFAAAVWHQISLAGTSTSAMASANGEGCSRGDLGRLGSVMAKEEAGGVGAPLAVVGVTCRRASLEADGRMNAGGGGEGTLPSRGGAVPALLLAEMLSLRSVPQGWGERWEPSAESHRLCREERGASCPAVPVPDPTGRSR